MTDLRKLPFDASIQVKKLIVRVQIELYSNALIKTGCEKLYYNPVRLDVQELLVKINHEIEMEFKFFRKFFPDLFKERKFDLEIVAGNEIFEFHSDLVKGITLKFDGQYFLC